MFKKKKEVDKSNFTDYEKAKDEFLDYYGKTSARLNSWKMMCFISLALVFLSVSGVVYLSTRSSLIPYVIEVDETGNAKAINPAYQVNYDPNEANIKYFLSEFIKSRWLSSDQVLQGSLYQKAIAFLTNETKEKYNAIVKAENWTEMIKNGFTRDLQIESINKVAGTNNSYQIRWVETVYNKGTFIDSKKMLGIFSIKIEQPTDLEELSKNPLGIKIEDFHISNEK